MLDLNKFPKIKKLVLRTNREEDAVVWKTIDDPLVGCRTRLTGIPMINGIENLEELDMSYLGIAEIPYSIQNFRGLKNLYLKRNHLHELPRSIGNLTNLEILILGTDDEEHPTNSLETLPDTIGNLVNLKELHLYGCNLRELPATIGNLRNLKLLDLGSNELLELPESIGNLKKLETLTLGWPWDVSISNIRSWERETGISYLSYYRNKKNMEVKIPITIGNLVNLQKLRLSNNLGLKTLPKSIGNLVNLQGLNLSCNSELKTLPESIGNLTNLKYFSVDDHIALSPTVRNLKKLGSRKLKELEKQIVD